MGEFFQQIWPYLLSGISGGGISLFFVWLFKEALISRLKLSLEKQALEHKHQLDALQERMKVDLQRDLLLQQSLFKERFNVFPELHLKLLTAHGQVDQLAGFSYAPDWPKYSDAEVLKAFEDRNPDSNKIQAILTTRTTDSGKGNKELGDYYRALDFRDARHAVQEAKNCALKNSLFMKPELFESSWKAAVELSHALVSLSLVRDLPNGYKDAKEHIKTAVDEMEKVKASLRQELGVIAIS